MEWFKRNMVEAAVMVCGSTSNRERWKETPLWNDRVKEAVRKKNKALEYGSRKGQNLKGRSIRIRRKADSRQIVTKVKRKWIG